MTRLLDRRALLAALLFAACLAPLQAAPELPRETWFGVYQAGIKVGHLKTRTESARFRGKDALKTSSVARLDFLLGGTRESRDISEVEYSDLEGRPIYVDYRKCSDGKTTEVLAVVGQDRINCRKVTADGPTLKTIPIPAGAVLVSDTDATTLQHRPVVGARYEWMVFDAADLALEKSTSEVLREETIEHEGARVRAVVIRTVDPSDPTDDTTTWLSPDGSETYLSRGGVGLAIRREPKEKAAGLPTGASSQPPQDLKEVEVVWPDERRPPDTPLSSLTVRLSGYVDASCAIADERQRVTAQTEGPTSSVTYEISAREPSPAAAGRLPVKDRALKAWLQPDKYANSDHPAIVKEARRLVGREKNIVKAAEKIRLGVEAMMTPDESDDDSEGFTPPASDILKNPRGVCRHYATLFTALARAAGIPARTASGLTFSDGSFGYHAWAEVWTGREWMAVEPQSANPPDAGYIKLFQSDTAGEPISKTAAGPLKVEVQEFR